MPYFVRIGPIETNKCGVGSRGYHLFRRGKKITARWGAVIVTSNKKIYWCYTQTRVWPYRSEKSAMKAMRELVEARVEADGYKRLPVGVKIQTQ